MTFLQSLIMGVVQGLAEFLPVSSSGHLALLDMFFPIKDGGIAFSVLLHVGTLVAAIVYFRKDIFDLLRSLSPKNKEMKAERRTVLSILIVTLVTAPIGLLFNGPMDALSKNLVVLGLCFIGTTVVLSAAEYFTHNSGKREPESLGPVRAAFIGLVQGLAVLPGLSRAGMTIAGGMATGMSREKATRFSFLVSLPIIAAAALLDGLHVIKGTAVLPSASICAVGFIASAVAGYFAIAIMIDLVKRIKLYWFAGYTFILGVILLALHFFG